MNKTRLLAGIFVTSGVLHFVKPEFYERIIPKPLLPYKTELVQVSGAAELVCAGMLVVPPTRRLGGLLSFGLLLGVFPANVQMMVSAFQNERSSLLLRVGSVLRLPMQLPMLRWAWKAWSGSAKEHP